MQKATCFHLFPPFRPFRSFESTPTGETDLVHGMPRSPQRSSQRPQPWCDEGKVLSARRSEGIREEGRIGVRRAHKERAAAEEPGEAGLLVVKR